MRPDNCELTSTVITASTEPVAFTKVEIVPRSTGAVMKRGAEPSWKKIVPKASAVTPKTSPATYRPRIPGNLVRIAQPTEVYPAGYSTSIGLVPYSRDALRRLRRRAAGDSAKPAGRPLHRRPAASKPGKQS